VTGGIGQQLAYKFIREGWNVIGTGRSHHYNGVHINNYIVCDLGIENNIVSLFEKTKSITNKLDCIINNAACQICKPIIEHTIEDIDSVYNCNIKAIFIITKLFFPLLKNNGTSNIINIGSVHSQSTSINISAYASSKAALSGLTRNMALELSDIKCRVNCICPGAVDTKMLRNGLTRGHVGSGDEEELLNKLGEKHLLGKVGLPCEISSLAYEVCNNNFINGSNISIDGGVCIRLNTE
jgi:NAD(P)-dependent dehydrogenase (short-subunit alcohol dehydrogenase family)